MESSRDLLRWWFRASLIVTAVYAVVVGLILLGSRG